MTLKFAVEPSATEVFDGFVIVGDELTVSAAGLLQTVDVEFVTQARNCKLLKAAVGAWKTIVG